MRILVCIKRVPDVGSEVMLTADGQSVDARHVGYTVSNHESSAVELAIRVADATGGSVTLVTVGSPESTDQLRHLLGLGCHAATLVEADPTALGPSDVARELGDDVGERPRQRADVRLHRERQPHRVAWGGVGVLPDDKDPHDGQRARERSEDRVAGRQVPVTGGDLGAQEVPGRPERGLDRCERDGPVGGDEVGEGSVRHTARVAMTVVPACRSRVGARPGEP